MITRQLYPCPKIWKLVPPWTPHRWQTSMIHIQQLKWHGSCGNEDGQKLAIMQNPVIAKEYVEIPDSIPSAERFITTQAVELTVRKITHGWTIKKQWLNNYSNMIIHLRSCGSGYNPNDDFVWMLRRPLLDEPIVDEKSRVEK